MSYTPKDDFKAPESFTGPEASDDSGEPKFEPTIPWQTALELVALVRSGDIKENKIRALQLGAWVVGCSATAIGEREDGDVVITANDVQPQKAVATGLCLESLADALEEQATGVSAQGLNIAQIIALVMQIMELIAELKK